MRFPYPMLFKPVYQNYIWGGDRIVRRYNRNEAPGVYAESWEVSARPEGASVVSNGSLRGQALTEVIEEHGEALIGSGRAADRFPLLIKLIDARETLSVQVHPDDATAEGCGGEAKTEMWYVLEADPSACVYAGLKPGVTEQTLREAIRDQTVDAVLNVVPVRAGDAVFMPGGRVHAIGAGCLLLEVQQNSNTTYRLYDWGRVGPDGKPRPLHVDEAVQVIRWQDDVTGVILPRRLGNLEQNELWEVCSCPWFRMERLVLREPWPAGHDGRSFHVVFCPDAAINIHWDNGSEKLPAGTSCLIPAALTQYQLEPLGPSATVLRTSCP